jgi:lipoprotein-anchoring transpeptidase ErfK/SrfK
MSALRCGRESRFHFGWVGKLSTVYARHVGPLRGDMSRRSLLGAASAVVIACAFAMTASPAHAQSWGQFWEPQYQPRPRLKPKPKPPQAEHLSKEPFGQIPKGPVQIIISIDQQKLHVYSDGAEIAETLIATGVPAHPTPVGVFSVIEKSILHHSNIYSGAPMPYMQRITWSGVALHEGGNLGHPASHGCIRMPHDFATRLFVLTKLGARVIIARPELQPSDFADVRLFVHKDSSPASTAAAPAMERPIKTAQTVDSGKTIDAPTTKSDEGAAQTQNPAKDASGALASAQPDEASSGITLRKTIGADALVQTAGDPINATASEAPKPDKPGAGEATLEAPLAPPVPVPPAKPVEIARTAPKTPISIFVSRKDKKIYVRQDFLPLFNAPITIDRADQSLGTHVFTAMEYLDDHSRFRWNVVSLPGEPPKILPKTSRAAVVDARSAKGNRRGENVAPTPLSPPLTPQEVLARVEIPPDVIERISHLIIPGSSLVVSDQGLGEETGQGTDFIVVMR